MIIYIYGEDTFRSREYLKEQVAKFKTARDPQGYNVVFLESAKAESGKILSEILATPFLAEKRMVILENVLSNSNKELLGNLIERVKNNEIPESNIIVFYQSEPIRKVPAKGGSASGGKEAKELETLLKKEKYSKGFSLLSGAQLQSWIASEVKNRGGNISANASQYLSVNVAGDMWHLNTLIDQLVAYKQNLPFEENKSTPKDSEIQIADTQLFLDEKIDDNIFNMAEAIASGNKKNAFKLLNHQRNLGEEEMHLFLMILRQFRILTQMRVLYEENEKISSDELARDLGLHPFVVKKSLALMKRFSLVNLKELYNKLLEIDLKTKTGAAPQAVLMDLFIGEIQ